MVNDDTLVVKIIRKQYDMFLDERKIQHESVDKVENADNMKGRIPFQVFLRTLAKSARIN